MGWVWIRSGALSGQIYLLGEDTGTQVFQRDLETPGTVIVEDLDGN